MNILEFNLRRAAAHRRYRELNDIQIPEKGNQRKLSNTLLKPAVTVRAGPSLNGMSKN
jgi:hypothetical protein